MKKALLSTVLACFLIPGVRAQQPSYFSIEAAQQREELERQQKEQDEREENIAKNLFGQPPENANSEQLPVSNLNQLDEARKQYWAAYEKGDRVKLLAAKTVFSDLLFLRDLVALWTDPAAQDKPLDRLMAMTLHLSIPPGDEIPASAQEYFGKWSIAFHGDIRPPGPGEATNINSIIASFKRHFSEYYPYEVARDWAEDMRAPVPLPIENFVFDLVQRWPLPAPFEQAQEDYKVLLNIFGRDRLFAVAEKVRNAMDQDGTIKDPAALGIDTSLATEDSPKVKHWKAEVERMKQTPGMQGYVSTAEHMVDLSKREQNGEHVGYFAHNCYEVLWTLLTKDDPKLTALCQIYRARLKGLGGADLGAFTYRTENLSLKSIVQEWNAPTPTPSAQASPLKWFTDKDSAIAAAIDQHKKIFVFVSLNNCEEGKLMEPFFSQKRFVDFASQKLVLLKLAFTGKRNELNEEAKRYLPDGYDNNMYWGIFQPDLRIELFGYKHVADEDQTFAWIKYHTEHSNTITGAPMPKAEYPVRWDTWEMPSYLIKQHRQNLNILVYFSSDQSSLCDKMNKEVLDTSNSFVDFATRNLANVKLNRVIGRELKPLEEGEETQRVQLIKQFNITGYPTFVLLNKTGEEISRCVGFTEEGPFVKWLTEANKETKFPSPPPGPTEAVSLVSTASSPIPTVVLSSTPAPIPAPAQRSTPAPTPTPTPTPYPEAADLWREREHVVKQEYDKAWTALPDATRLQLHDGEVTFRDTIKTFDPPTRMRTLKKRIEYLKSLTPRSAAVPTPAPNPTPTPRADSVARAEAANDQTELRRAGAEQDQGSPQSSANVQETPIRPKAPADRARAGTRQSLNLRRSGLTDSDDEPPSSDTPDLPKNSAEQTLRDFIITGQADDVSRRAAHLMDDLTKFYDRGAISRQEACALMAAYNRKWPIRRFRPDDLSVQVERIDRGVFKLSQSFDWEVSDGRRRKTGRSRIVCEILQTDGDYKIVSVDEVKE